MARSVARAGTQPGLGCPLIIIMRHCRTCASPLALALPPFAERSGEIWITDLESGRSASLAPGFQAFDYDVSADGQKVVLDAEDVSLTIL